MSVTPAVVVGLVVLPAALALWRLQRAHRVTPADLAWIGGSVVLPDDEAAVYVAYLRRHRWHRVWGAILGVVTAVVVGARWYQEVTIGTHPNPVANVLTAGLLGCAVGALLAESYRIRAVTGIPRAASLVPRARAATPRRVVAARALAVAGFGVGVLAIVTGDRMAFAIASIAIGLLLVGVAELTLRAIADRARPALSERAAVVDGRLRAFGRERVAWLELAGAGIMTATVWACLVDPDVPEVSPMEAGPVETGAVVVQVAALILTVVALHRASPYPPRRAAGSPAAEPARA